MAFLSSLITNIATRVHGKKGAKMTELMDFMPDWGKEESSIKVETGQQTVEQQKRILEMIASSFKKGNKKPKK